MTSLDKDAYEFLKPHAFNLSPLTNPYTFAYYGLICKFDPKAMTSWPTVEGAPAPAKATKKADDEMDDLFGSDDEEDAEAAKKAAAAAKEKA